MKGDTVWHSFGPNIRHNIILHIVKKEVRDFQIQMEEKNNKQNIAYDTHCGRH